MLLVENGFDDKDYDGKDDDDNKNKELGTNVSYQRNGLLQKPRL